MAGSRQFSDEEITFIAQNCHLRSDRQLAQDLSRLRGSPVTENQVEKARRIHAGIIKNQGGNSKIKSRKSDENS